VCLESGSKVKVLIRQLSGSAPGKQIVIFMKLHLALNGKVGLKSFAKLLLLSRLLRETIPLTVRSPGPCFHPPSYCAFEFRIWTEIAGHQGLFSSAWVLAKWLKVPKLFSILGEPKAVLSS
jgi:hypothetical protein